MIIVNQSSDGAVWETYVVQVPLPGLDISIEEIYFLNGDGFATEYGNAKGNSQVFSGYYSHNYKRVMGDGIGDGYSMGTADGDGECSDLMYTPEYDPQIFFGKYMNS
jgi:hypothetical protein